MAITFGKKKKMNKGLKVFIWIIIILAFLIVGFVILAFTDYFNILSLIPDSIKLKLGI